LALTRSFPAFADSAFGPNLNSVIDTVTWLPETLVPSGDFEEAVEEVTPPQPAVPTDRTATTGGMRRSSMRAILPWRSDRIGAVTPLRRRAGHMPRSGG
jgi:hypothetical protein